VKTFEDGFACDCALYCGPHSSNITLAQSDPFCFQLHQVGPAVAVASLAASVQRRSRRTLGDRILGDRVDVGRGFDDDANPHIFD